MGSQNFIINFSKWSVSLRILQLLRKYKTYLNKLKKRRIALNL